MTYWKVKVNYKQIESNLKRQSEQKQTSEMSLANRLLQVVQSGDSGIVDAQAVLSSRFINSHCKVGFQFRCTANTDFSYIPSS